MEIVRLTEKEYEEAIQLSMYAFQYKVSEEDIPKRKKMLDTHEILGVKDGEILVAKLHILPFSIYINHKEVSMGGVAGVSTFPEYRRHGYVKQLITEALKHMNNNDQYISFLHPFDINFYRRFGWEIFADIKKVTIQKGDLVRLKDPSGSVKRNPLIEDKKHIENLYERFATSHSGMLNRSKEWWNDHVYNQDHIAMFINDQGEYEGYLVYSVKNKEFEVIEIITNTHDAAIGLWNFICQHDSMVEKVIFTTSTHDLFPFYLKQPKQKIDILPYFMGRIVNVEKFLEQYSFLETGEKVFVHITDEYGHWNNGSYLIGDKNLSVFKEKEGSACAHPPKVGLQMEIGTLSTLLLGYKSVQELYKIGQIKGNIEDVDKLDKKIPRLLPFFPDFF